MGKFTNAKRSRGHRPAAMAAGGIALALASAPGAALALDTQAVWQGIATVTSSTTAQCAGVGGTVPGDAQVSVFRPKIASTDPNTFLSFVFFRSAFTLENTSEAMVHQMRGSGKDDVFGVNGRAKFFEGVGSYSLTITASPPGPVTAATTAVTISGKINNFFDVVGCNVSFEGVYGKRIPPF